MKLPKTCIVNSIEAIHREIRDIGQKKLIQFEANDVEKIDVSFVQVIMALQPQGLKARISRMNILERSLLSPESFDQELY